MDQSIGLGAGVGTRSTPARILKGAGSLTCLNAKVRLFVALYFTALNLIAAISSITVHAKCFGGQAMTRSFKELLATLSQEDMTRINVPLNPACALEVKQFRRAVRKLANVKSAQTSRRRKRELLAALKEENAQLRRENQDLVARVKSAESALCSLKVLTLPM